MELASVIVGGLALAKVVCLDFGWVGAEPLNVNFVQGVGFEDEGGDDAGAGSSLHCDFDAAKHDVEEGSKLRSIAALGDGEGDAIGAIFGGARGGKRVDGAFGKVDVDGHAETCVGWAAGCERESYVSD